MNIRLLLLLLSSFAFTFPTSVLPARTKIVDAAEEYSFGEQVTFRATLQSEVQPDVAAIFFQAQNDTHTEAHATSIQVLGAGLFELEYTHRIEDFRIPAFSNVVYHYEILLAGGDIYKTPEFKFYYSDNRFEWEQRTEKIGDVSFDVYWYEGDVAFAQSILDMAQEGYVQIQNLLPMSVSSSIKIYAYHDGRVMQELFGPFSETWIAGHADPDQGVIVLALPPGPDQRLLMEQRIPHELMHILLYQHTGQGYANLPTWLNEGLASLAELYPNSDYEVILEHAIENNRFLPMSSLCNRFPRDASSALLSYAQAESFTRYIYNTYGTSGLQELVRIYANGVDCSRGLESAFGLDLDQMERHWMREALSGGVSRSIVNNLLPWLVLLGAALSAPLFLVFRWLIIKVRGYPVASIT